MQDLGNSAILTAVITRPQRFVVKWLHQGSFLDMPVLDIISLLAFSRCSARLRSLSAGAESVFLFKAPSNQRLTVDLPKLLCMPFK